MSGAYWFWKDDHLQGGTIRPTCRTEQDVFVHSDFVV